MLQTQQHAIIWGYPFYIIITQSYKLIKVITLRAHPFLPSSPPTSVTAMRGPSCSPNRINKCGVGTMEATPDGPVDRGFSYQYKAHFYLPQWCYAWDHDGIEHEELRTGDFQLNRLGCLVAWLAGFLPIDSLERIVDMYLPTLPICISPTY